MIGQKDLLEKIDKILPNYPKFSIIVGPKGSGKQEICKYICSKLTIPMIKYGQKIEDVRDVVTLAYEQTKPICYAFIDADTMSLAAKNCLLKVTEEPPQNAYFILTLESIENTLSTIESRGTVLILDNYSSEELIEYRKYRRYSDSSDNLISQICSSTGEVDELFKCDVLNFYKFADSVAVNIDKVNSGNIFKISKNMKLKDTDDGFDPILLFKTVRNIYIDKAIEEKDKKYLYASNVTTRCLQDLRLVSVSKQATIDKWIMDVRQVLRS